MPILAFDETPWYAIPMIMLIPVWHGRNSYKRSAKLAQFVIHRGLIISVCQTVYSITYAFAPIALYQVKPSQDMAYDRDGCW